MNKRVNFYFAALLGTMSPLCAVPALASNRAHPIYLGGNFLILQKIYTFVP